MKRRIRTDVCLILCGILVWFLADARQLRLEAAKALTLCAGTVIPGLLVRLGFGQWLAPDMAGLMASLFRLPGCAGSALLLGLVGGYPIGARTAAELYASGDLTRQEAERLLDEAGWKTGADGIREKDGKKAGFTMLYSAGDSVRQALSEDTANQLAAFGIHVTVEGVGWDTAYDRAQSEPLMWGWGAHTPMELYNIYHTRPGGKYAQYSPYSNGAVDAYMDEALACTDLEASYELWKKAQWDGGTGITQEGDLPWIWLVNIDHLYWVKDGLQVAEQKLHPHGHGWSIINNVDQWTWE